MQTIDRHGATTLRYPALKVRLSIDFERYLLSGALVYAILVSPFIGGIRGWPCTFGWLSAPALWLWCSGDTKALGLGLTGPKQLRHLALAIAGGLLFGFGFFALGKRFPMIAQFTLALPALHRSADYGNVRLFIALIPVGHFVHELFYRGFLQGQLRKRLQSPWLAILLCALLYSWTHIFIYSSTEFQQIMGSILGNNGDITHVHRTLAAVVSFAMIESVGAGFAVHATKSIWPGVVFRVTNLVTLILLVYPRFGLL